MQRAVAGGPAGPGGPAAVGFFSFTQITDPGGHRGYNEWHQLDHLPEQLPLPGILAGQRWVSTPACRRARVASAPELDPVHYMTLYLMAEPVAETLDAFISLGRRLHAEDRFFADRRALLSGPFRVTDAAAAPRVHVSAAALPHRPNRGVYVSVEHVEPTDAQAPVPSLVSALLETDGVAGVWTFGSDPTIARSRWRSGDHRITVCYLDRDPLAVALALDTVFAAHQSADTDPVLGGPFLTIQPWQWDWFDQD